METRRLSAASETDLRAAARLLRAGRVVAFPTETVYGLGARADDERAVRALLEVKERPEGKSFTVLVADPDAWTLHVPSLPDAALALAEAFWPGPLTLVVPDGRGGTVGLRCPDHDATRRMLRAAAVPVAAPSANLSGRPPATSAEEVLAVFDGRIAAVLDGGPARIGAASTVVRADEGGIEVLREGALTAEALERALDSVVEG